MQIYSDGQLYGGTPNAVLLYTGKAGDRLVYLDPNDATRQFRFYCNDCPQPPPNAAPVQMLGYRRQALLGNRILDTVWKQENTVIAPNLGMVQFVKPGTTDTFYLQRTNF